MSTQGTTDYEALKNPLTEQLELEDSIKHAIGRIGINKKDIKKKQKEIKDRLLADSSYSRITDEIKEMKKELLKAKKLAIAHDPLLEELTSKIKSIRADTKGFQLSLSDYLVEFEKKTGQTSIQDDSDNTREIQITAKVV